MIRFCPMAEERIVAAAIKIRDVGLCLPPPERHHNVLRHALNLGFSDDEVFAAPEGFVTDRGRFVDRHEGWRIATAAGQIIETFGCPPNTLFSEHMW